MKAPALKRLDSQNSGLQKFVARTVQYADE